MVWSCAGLELARSSSQSVVDVRKKKELYVTNVSYQCVWTVGNVILCEIWYDDLSV